MQTSLLQNHVTDDYLLTWMLVFYSASIKISLAEVNFRRRNQGLSRIAQSPSPQALK